MRFRIVAAALAVMAIPTIAGAHGGDNTASVVHACVGNITKIVRIVGVTGVCITSPAPLAETPVHWAIQGAPGPQGAPGAPGTTGAPGAPGATGPAGPSGGLIVKDSLNQTVGTTAGPVGMGSPRMNQERLIMKRDGEVFTLPISAGGFVVPPNYTNVDEVLYFSSPGCTGTVNYAASDINSTPGDFGLVRWGLYRDGKAIIRDLSQAKADIAISSLGYMQDGTFLCNNFAAVFPGRPAKMIDLSDIVGPFHIE